MSSDILQQYSVIVEFLGKTLGPDYEIVLQDLTPGHRQITAIANGHVSSRKIGAPLTDAALTMLANKSYETSDFICNYKGIAEDGHILRSSTMFIKDTDGNPIGLLCINFDDSRYTELLRQLLNVIHTEDFSTNLPGSGAAPASPAPSLAQPEPITENFSMDISSLMQKIFDDATVSLSTPLDRLNQSEKKEIMQTLHKRGLFQLKGAIPFVAKHFSCSAATIYRYLSELANDP